MFDIDLALRTLVERDGSDLHVKVGSPAMARVQGTLVPLMGGDALGPDDTERALQAILHDDTKMREFDEGGEVDFAYSIRGLSRFRVNAFRQRGSVSIACRAIPYQVKTIEELGLPPAVRSLADSQRGIVLLTGTTGSGKSTTLAAMINHINANKARHIITLEDPIEYLHRDKMSIINQREVGTDTAGFNSAMRRILRQDPDVILIGEMRDEETVRTALSAAETGHLVLSTLHTLDATETISRIIDFFPPHHQQQARVMLSSTLQGAISQRLVPTIDGKGRVAVSEVLVATGRVKDLILLPEETAKIGEVIGEGSYYGMQTFDQDLLSHVTAGRISEKVGYDTASSPHDFKLMLQSGGQRASGIEQLLESPDAEDEAVPKAPSNGSGPVEAAPSAPPMPPGPTAAPPARPIAPAIGQGVAPPPPPPGTEPPPPPPITIAPASPRPSAVPTGSSAPPEVVPYQAPAQSHAPIEAHRPD